jgi:indolepyruvate ferredoxin oxidoreductase alpha subunit
VLDAVEELRIADCVQVLKLGMTHPFPDGLLAAFLEGMDRVFVVEELEPYLEERLKVVAQERHRSVEIGGKGLLSRAFEFDPAQVRCAMARFFRLDYEAIRVEPGPELPPRPPNLCAGCPHRATFYAVKQAIGDSAVFPTDIGCYTLGLLPPLQAADFLLCMGSSVSSAGGFSKVQDRPVVAFIGDSTFFHSGITGLINAIQNRHNFTLVILDNGTTAMTGHQPHPGVELTPEGRQAPRVSLEAVVRGCGVERVVTVQPLQVKRTIERVREVITDDGHHGVRVIISKAPCPLFERRLTGKRQKVVFQVGKECDLCRRCLNDLGCPAFTYREDAETGASIAIDEMLCSGCAVCSQICHAVQARKKGE